MTYRRLCCWDCGAPVIHQTGTHISLLPVYRHVRFRLTNDRYCESPFCQSCAERPWTRERLQDFERALNATKPPFAWVHVVACEGIQPTPDQVVGVMP